ncbi:MAG: hypothetical protein ACYCZO_07260, partial [Daejeonella sp.]
WCDDLYEGSTSTGEYTWFDTVTLGATITVTGIDYLNQYRLTESNIAVNEASKRSSRIQKRFTFTTIIVAAVGAFSTFFTFICNNPKIQGVEQRIDTLEKIQDKQSKELKYLQNLRVSPTNPSHNGQPSSSDTVRTTSDKKIK